MNEPPGTRNCDTRPSPHHASQRAWVAPMRVTDEIIPGPQAGDSTLGAGYSGGPPGAASSLGLPEATQAFTSHTVTNGEPAV